LLGTASWAALATLVDNKYATMAMIPFNSLSVAFSDVVTEIFHIHKGKFSPV
jgi:hypothetical protein